MSMISEQVKKLRTIANHLAIGHGMSISMAIDLFKEAADTIEKLSAKLTKVNMERSDKYYSDGWILCEDRLPEEHESIFVKFKGTSKWNSAMFEKISDEVNVTVEFEDGKRKVMTLHTCDGKWKSDIQIVKFKVIAWQPLPEPYHYKDNNNKM